MTKSKTAVLTNKKSSPKAAVSTSAVKKKEKVHKYYAVLDFSFNLKKKIKSGIDLKESLDREYVRLFLDEVAASEASDPRYDGEELVIIEVDIKQVGVSKDKNFIGKKGYKYSDNALYKLRYNKDITF